MTGPADVPPAVDAPVAAPRRRFPARAFQADPVVRAAYEPPSHRAWRTVAVTLLVATTLLAAWVLLWAGAAPAVLDLLRGYLGWLPFVDGILPG